jgi:hypothetical protein
MVHAHDALEDQADEEGRPDAACSPSKSFDFRTYHGAETALYHALGALPEPEFTHRFC